MGHWKKHYSTEHLDAADIIEIPEGQAHIKIAGIGDVTLEGEKGTEKKAVIHFHPGPAMTAAGVTKTSWVAAKTCGYCLEAMFGPDTDNWIGKRVTLRSERVSAFGDVTDAVRVMGSPDLAAPKTIRVRAGKKKATITLVPTNDGALAVRGNGSAAARPTTPSRRPSEMNEPPDDVALPPFEEGGR